MMKVNEQTEAVKAMVPAWDLVDALYGGTEAMRAKGKRYLPQRTLEEDSDYAQRLAAATLFPAFRETVGVLTGRAFAEPPVVNDAPDWIKNDVLPDVDLQGRKLAIFAQDVFEESLRYGLTHVLVESPAFDASQVRTRADQRTHNVRPYLIQVNPRRVLGWKAQNGKLTQVRIQFWRTENDGDFGEIQVEQIRVYEDGVVTTYERTGAKRDGDFARVGEPIATGIPGIPLVTFYTKRTGLLTAEPPLKELAYLNAKHWRIQSSVDSLLDTASVPILLLTGLDDDDATVELGAKHALKLPKGCDAKFVEHTGAAIKTGRDALQDLKEEMRQVGAKLLATRGEQTKTATQAGEESARENSQLGAMVHACEDAIVQVLDLIASYRGAPTGGTIRLDPNLDPDFTPVESMRILLDLRNASVLSDQTLFEEAKRRGLVSEDLEWEEEQDRLLTQTSANGLGNDPLNTGDDDAD